MLDADHRDIPFDLEWLVMPQEHQILSENASVDYWNSLASTVEPTWSPPSDDPFMAEVTGAARR